MKTRLTWHGDAVMAKLLDESVKRCKRVAYKLADAVRANISTPGPEHSKPGEYPRKQSGELLKGIRVIQRNQYRFDVVSESEHAGIVEEIRPYFERTLTENMDMLERAARGRS